MTFYLAGNIAVDIDNKPILWKDRLEKDFIGIIFEVIDSVDDIPKVNELYLIDTVIGIDKVRIFTDMNIFENSPGYSTHDLDIGMTLKLMKNIGYIKDIYIIGVPSDGDIDDVYQDLCKVIRSILSSKNS